MDRNKKFARNKGPHSKGAAQRPAARPQHQVPHRASPANSKPRLILMPQLATNERLVIGKNAVREVLKHRGEEALKLIRVEKSSAGPGPDVSIDAEFEKLLQSVEIETVPISRDQLTKLANTDSHQNIAVVLREQTPPKLREYLEAVSDRERCLLVALDGVTDPQNLGTILRSSECFGADAILWSWNRSSGITPVVTKASAGASELVPSIPVANLNEAIRAAKENNFWVVIAECAEGAQALPRFEFPGRTLLILGSEGAGVRKHTSELADFRVTIPMQGKIDSLNVAQALTVMLYAYRSQHAVSENN